jgi:hypothetical protein
LVVATAGSCSAAGADARNWIVATATATATAHLDPGLETDVGKPPLLHGMEEKAGVRRSLSIKGGGTGLPSVASLKYPSPRPSPRSFVAGRGSSTVSE